MDQWLCGAREHLRRGRHPPKVRRAGGRSGGFNSKPRRMILAPALTGRSRGSDPPARFPSTNPGGLDRPELVRDQSDDPTRMIAAARTVERDVVAVYLPDNAQVSIDLSGCAGPLRGRWFNPLTGETVPLPDAIAPSASAKFARPDGWADAALVLTTRRAHRAASR